MVAPRELGTHPLGHDQYFFASYATDPSCISVCQNVAILYTISRQIATSTNIENAERV